jgi:uncharacterized protein YbgA (DUF1722 family)
MVVISSGEDVTDRMQAWALRRVQELESERLCGFVFRSGSPSSGMERVKVYDRNGVPSNSGVGLFARCFMEHFPFLPVEEEGRLHDPQLRENFIERIFTYKRWQEMEAQGRSRGRLVEFHTRHKLLLLSRGARHVAEAGRLVAGPPGGSLRELFQRYRDLLMESLRVKATARKNTNVLHHIMGYFKKDLSADEKQELLEVIGRYHGNLVPLIVPVTLLNHYVRKYDQAYLQTQYYLHPHPAELKLRNHV